MENLEKKTRDELREIAKELNIAGRGRMTKAQLIEAVASAQPNGDNACAGECTNEGHGNGTDNVDHTKKAEDKAKRIESAEIGTLVAFKLPNGKVKSAKIEKKSSKRKVFKLVAQYGAEFIVPYDDVIWVRTGSRWPKGVYNLLKGITKVDDPK